MSVKRIFHLQFGTDGGTEQFFLRLTRAFHERGIEQQFAIRPGVTWRHELDDRGTVHEGYYLRRWPNWWLRTQLLKRSMKQWPADVVMGWRAPTSRLMPDAGHAIRVVRLGDYPHHVRYFGNTDAIVGNAPNVIEHCRTLGWQGKTTIISNFPGEVGTSVVKRSDFSTPDDVPLVCGLGRFVPTKGFDTLLRAVATTPHLWLWLVGDGPDRADLEQLVQELGIADRVRFIGWVSEPAAYIKAADMFCVPSRQEPLGNVLLEGWKAEVAVVSTKTEGPSWAAAHDESALFTEIDDVEGMAQALLRLEGSPELRAKLVQGGREQLAARFSAERIVDQYLEFFEELRSSRR
ncbi:hypothetical protein ASF03_08375 [Rhizobium sp. Leaf68]|nr:hypothetical protein ASE62_08265 [Rhizobium sp. Leaf202]KQN85666.1 hypothetical protein ASF03_08375 [Rhizobium sp. Leaf68]